MDKADVIYRIRYLKEELNNILVALEHSEDAEYIEDMSEIAEKIEDILFDF